MLKPLIINRYYLFKHSPVGECLRSFVGGMPKEEWAPTVYCSDMKPLLDIRGIHEIVTHEYVFVKYVAAAIRRILPDLTFLPGYEWQSWGKGVVKRILKDIKKGSEFDYIHSISFPCASHTVALELKRKTGLPWVMQFYDPWADNPYRRFKTKYFKDKDWAMERTAVEEADLIIHDNEVIADLWRKRYGSRIANKIVVLPLTVPLPQIEQTPAKYSGKEPMVLSHIGNFMLNRRALPFIVSVVELFKKHPDVRSQLKVKFIGTVTSEDKELIRSNGLNDIFELLGTLPAAECEKYYQQTDMFLAVDGVNPDNLFFPSKILKYFYFQRPILGITPNGSVMYNELSRSGHAVFNNEETDAISDYLYKAITDYCSILNFDATYWKTFEPSLVLQRYKSFIDGTITK